jgi:hypothetical protein
MISPTVDDRSYMESIPTRLKESGLHVPSFVCFECPIPGTPHFYRLASEQTPAFIPNALLRDFSGYTLVTRPKHEPVEGFLEAYKSLIKVVYSKGARIAKLADDLPRFMRGGYWSTMLGDLIDQRDAGSRPHPGRTYLAGTDVPPPEATTVPLTEDDFASDDERNIIMRPWRVTDSKGRVLPEWLQSIKVFASRGSVSARAQRLVSAPGEGEDQFGAIVAFNDQGSCAQLHNES